MRRGGPPEGFRAGRPPCSMPPSSGGSEGPQGAPGLHLWEPRARSQPHRAIVLSPTWKTRRGLVTRPAGSRPHPWPRRHPHPPPPPLTLSRGQPRAPWSAAVLRPASVGGAMASPWPGWLCPRGQEGPPRSPQSPRGSLTPSVLGRPPSLALWALTAPGLPLSWAFAQPTPSAGSTLPLPTALPAGQRSAPLRCSCLLESPAPRTVLS